MSVRSELCRFSSRLRSSSYAQDARVEGQDIPRLRRDHGHRLDPFQGQEPRETSAEIVTGEKGKAKAGTGPKKELHKEQSLVQAEIQEG